MLPASGLINRLQGAIGDFPMLLEKDFETIHLTCNGVFMQVGFLPNTEFCRDIMSLNKDGEIIINPDCSTSTPGIFACGDVTNAYGKRIIIASGEGAKAILSVKKYLTDKKRQFRMQQT